MTTTTTTRPEICEGVRFLDTEYPQWFNEIDPANLDLESGMDCVLGQLNEANLIGQRVGPGYSYGYGQAINAIFPDDSTDDEMGWNDDDRSHNRWAENRGFFVLDADRFGYQYDEEAYEALTAEWVEVIEAKQAGTDDGCEEEPTL